MADKGPKIGVWAFIIGLLLAVVLALFSAQFAGQYWPIVVLAVLGLLVGLLNVTAQETQKFLIATIAFIVSLTALSSVFQTLSSGAFGGVWSFLASFFGLVAVFMAPAAFVVAIKALYALARD